MTRPTSPRPTLTLPARDILPARERGWDEVVVGTDGSPSALRALAWASREAQLRGSSLRVATVGEPVAANLLVEAAQASVLVVGTRGRGALTARIFGSVSQAVAADATCPVVVVRGPGAGSATERCKPVVVGVDAELENPAVVSFAARAAALRSMPLHVLASWSLPSRAGAEVAHHQGGALAEWAARLAEEARVTAEATRARVRAAWPGLDGTTSVVAQPTSKALLACAPGALLVVIGARGHGRVGPAARVLLQHASCPVALVPSATQP
jgi:nucleotide-binding universal stress UspA family protein